MKNTRKSKTQKEPSNYYKKSDTTQQITKNKRETNKTICYGFKYGF